MLKKENIQDAYTLSPMQEGILFHALYEKDSQAYFQQMMYRITGDFDIALFQKSWIALVQRHDILRTVFVWKNAPRPLQFVLKNRQMDFAILDLKGLDSPAQQEKIKNYQLADRKNYFDLNKDLLIRVAVFQLEAQSYQIMLSFHHILMDGWCMPILQQELLEYYLAFTSNRPPSLPPVTPYRNYIQWLEAQDKTEAINFWKTHISDYDNLATLPKKSDINGYILKNLTIEFEAVTTAQLNQMASRHQVTLNTIIQAVWGMLLAQYNNVHDVVFGVTVSGRPPHIQGIERMLGLFINTIPLRVRLEPSTAFKDLLQQIQQDASASISYHYSSLAEIQSHSLLKNGLLDHIIVFESFPPDTGVDENRLGFSVRQIDEFEQTNYDLEITAFPSERLTLRFSYNAEAFESKQIESVASHFKNIIHAVLKDDGVRLKHIEMLDEAEKHFLLTELNASACDYPQDKTIAALFEEQAALHPHDTAVEFGNTRLTYAELNIRVNHLARYLRQTYNIQPDELIGIMLDRSDLLLIGILGILKSGAAYVPIDPEYPEERIDYIIRNSACKVLITEKKYQRETSDSNACDIHAALLAAPNLDAAGQNPPLINEPGHLAYVIYTSGSTGNPKGVMLTHQDVVSFNVNMTQVYGMKRFDRILALTTITFDISVLELITSLLSGLTVVISPDAEIRDPAEILANIQKYNVNVLQITPSRLKLLLENREVSALEGLRVLLIGGEPLPQDLFERLKPLFSTTNVFNVYGPTETTIWSTTKKINDGNLNIGRPLKNESVLILSKNNTLVPFGVIGEIGISGDGMARGYYQRPDLTEEKFIPHPCLPGARIYKTGDLGKWLPNGDLECLGRTDDQIKIRGYRIELGEIETCLKKHPSIKEAVVVAKDKDSTTRDLAAYLIAVAEIGISDLRAFLSKFLPDYMIPSVFVKLDKMPLTPNGKINKKALPDPRQSGLKPDTEYVAPRNDAEHKLTSLWKDVLQAETIGIHDNFFALGGHSLKATRLASKIHKELGIEIRLRDIFTCPTIAGLSALILNKETSALSPIVPLPKSESYALSHAQRRLWILDQMEGNFVAYNMPGVYRLERQSASSAEFDIAAFKQAVAAIIKRHEALRTIFAVVEGAPQQFIQPQIDNVLEESDLSDPAQDSAQIFQRSLEIAAKEAITPFDLSRSPLFRIKLLKLNATAHLLILNMHHIISDAWSMDVLTRELLSLYRAYRSEPAVVSLPELRIQYKDYAAWQNAMIAAGQTGESQAYWKTKLSGELPILNLPTDFPRPKIQTYQGNTVYFELNGEITAGLRKAGEQRQASLFMTLLALVKILLHRYSGQEDIIIGSPVSGRNHPDLEHQIGFYVNTLALRDAIYPTDTFATILEKVKQTTLDGYQHQLYPFDLLVNELNPARDLSRAPLFDVMLVVRHAEKAIPELDNMIIENLKIETGVSKFDLTYEVAEFEAHIEIGINYNTDLFKPDTIQRMIEHIQELAKSVIQHPDQSVAQLNLLSDHERGLVLYQFNETQYDFPQHKTLVDLFEEQVKKTPHALALIYRDISLTYAQLDELANDVAQQIVDQSVKPQSLLAMLTNRNEKAIIGLLGILKAGCVYVPIDPDYPEDRIRYMLEDSGSRCIVTESAHLAWAEEKFGADLVLISSARRTASAAKPSASRAVSAFSTSQSLAYVIYTSGSTGKPKGVMIAHRGFVNMILDQIRGFDIRETDRVLQFASLSFDASLSEIFMTLLGGAALVIADRQTIEEPSEFIDYVHRNQVSVATLPPTYLNALNRQGLDSLRTIITAGEPAIMSDAIFYSQSRSYFNAYGPTEISVCASYYKMPLNAMRLTIAPIGKPISNTQIFILDENMNPVPVGVVGEIWIAGEGLACGYLNQPEMTANKFLSDYEGRNPWLPAKRLYRSGDMGKWLPDGNLIFLGRKDDQVKIRGHRLELEEIEYALRQFQYIREAVVVATPQGELAAYIVAQEKREHELQQIKTQLQQFLPAFMIPAYFIPLAAIPLTPNKKVDKKALPPPDISPLKVHADDAPRNDLEKKLALVWEKVLGKKPIGIYDNFFDLGGNSIKAVSLAMLLTTELGQHIPVKLLFLHGSIAALAEKINNLERKS